jgi:hypothetical protein
MENHNEKHKEGAVILSKLTDIFIIVMCLITCAMIIIGLIVILPISAKCQNCSCNYNVTGGTINLTELGVGNLSLPGR